MSLRLSLHLQLLERRGFCRERLQEPLMYPSNPLILLSQSTELLTSTIVQYASDGGQPTVVPCSESLPSRSPVDFCFQAHLCAARGNRSRFSRPTDMSYPVVLTRAYRVFPFIFAFCSPTIPLIWQSVKGRKTGVATLFAHCTW